MMKYRVRLTPLESYTFGTDQNFSYPGEDYGKPTYIADTVYFPEQTTLLGMLKYEILKLKNDDQSSDFVLKDKQNYTSDDNIEIGKMIGVYGFDYKSDTNSFGQIKSISPVYLVKDLDGYTEPHILIRTPFNHINIKEKEDVTEYEPMAMNEVLVTSYGWTDGPENSCKDEESDDIRHKGSLKLGKKIPGLIEVDDKENGGKKQVHQYDTKKWHATSFLDINNGKLDKNDIFSPHTVTSNWIGGNTTGDDGLFKTKKVTMTKGYSFGVDVVVDDAVTLPEKSIVKMGKKAAVFKAEFKPVPDNVEDSLEEKVRQMLCSNATVLKNNKENNEIWYYALSDLILADTDYKQFCIVDEKSVRNIDKDGRKSRFRQNMAASGSVFFAETEEDAPKLENNETLHAIGYNYLIKIAP